MQIFKLYTSKVKGITYILFYCLLLLLCQNGFGQNKSNQFKIWQLTAYSGQASIRGNYNASISKNNDFSNKQSGTFLNSIFSLRTKSFFIHPNFMEVNINGNYNPATRRAYVLSAPEFSEKINNQGVDASAVIFKRKKINITTNTNINTNIINIENITRIKTKSKQFGAGLSYSNKILPFNLLYSQIKSEQSTIGSARVFFIEDRFYQVNASKSFSSHDENTLSYNHSINESLQTDNNLVPIHTYNNGNYFSFNNTFSLDKAKRYVLASAVSDMYKLGSNQYHTLNGLENLNLILTRKLFSTSTYNWGASKQGENMVNNRGFQSVLSHELYKSLNSRLSYIHNQMSQTDYKQQNNKFNINVAYTKIIPKGRISLSYNYTKEYQSSKTPATLLYILREAHVMDSSKIILLINGNVNIQSVIVKDSTGSIIYQKNIDYILIEHDPYVEILRIPGSILSKKVYIDYTSMLAGLYKFSGQNNGLSASTNLFKNKLTLYYSVSWQGYNNKSKSANLVLNYYTHQTMGLRLDFNYIRGGVEYQNYKSSLLPNKGMKYYFTFQKMYRNVNVILNGNMQDLQMTSENARRQNIDASLGISFNVFSNVKLQLDYMYRKVFGAVDNESFKNSNKLAISGVYHQIIISMGTQIYWYRYVNSKSNYNGVYIQVTRKF